MKKINIEDILKLAADSGGDDKVYLTPGQMEFLLTQPGSQVVKDDSDGRNFIIEVTYNDFRFQHAYAKRWWTDLVPQGVKPQNPGGQPPKLSLGHKLSCS